MNDGSMHLTRRVRAILIGVATTLAFPVAGYGLEIEAGDGYWLVTGISPGNDGTAICVDGEACGPARGETVAQILDEGGIEAHVYNARDKLGGLVAVRTAPINDGDIEI